MVSVQFERVTKILGQSRAVDGLTLAIKPGELFFLLGPSGCGKTTALRLVAGFYTPDEGRIILNERDQSRVAAAQAQHRHGVSKLCALAAHGYLEQRRLRAQDAPRIRG